MSPSLEARGVLCASGGRVPWIRQEGLYDLQLGLLSNGFRLLKEGGCLVYATCSLCQRQNEDVVKALLEKEPTAVLEALPCSLACERPGGAPARPSLLEAEGPRGEQGRYCTARFDPATSGTSGLFVARLRKTPGARLARSVSAGRRAVLSTPWSWAMPSSSGTSQAAAASARAGPSDGARSISQCPLRAASARQGRGKTRMTSMGFIDV